MSEPVALHLAGLKIQVTASPLSPSAFARFGSVIENPNPELHPASFAATTTTTSSSSGLLPFDPVSANQGSAIKYQHVTRMVNLYDQAAPSRRRGEAVMNMFVCAARKLDPPGVFPVRVLERHPFTTQTFVPLSSDPAKRYLVVVAPSLPPAPEDEGLPVPAPGLADPAVPNGQPRHVPLPGRGLPDLRGLRAFVATAEQAVTYGAGTWHAPMVALGPEGTTVDFVVVQFANGVPREDCQEAVVPPGVDSAVVVRIPERARGARL